MSFLYQTYPFVIELHVVQLDISSWSKVNGVLISSPNKSLIYLIVQAVQVLSLTSLSFLDFVGDELRTLGQKSPNA